jgi:DNA-binding beta-propeller fold protein YncE
VYVADRENSRIQLFTSEGDFIDAWLDVARPCEVFVDVDENVFVAELGYRAGMFPGNEAPAADATGGRVSVFSNAGSLLARWGGGSRPAAAGDFYAPHDLWIDRTGSIYVSEVIYSAGVNDPSRVQGGHTIQKFVRIEESP